MKNLNFKQIHFIGIGGISMSGLATLTISNNIKVSGSDISLNEETSFLQQLGAKIKKDKNLEGVKKAELIVFSSAISEDNEDLTLARKLQKQILERSEFLGLVAKNFKNVIAISGTHGKTTTTAMIAKILEEQNPTVHIGGQTKDFKNFKIGNDDYFITEACEYKKSFLKLKPQISIITNIEKDHMDCYKNEKELFESFLKFFKQTSNFAVINHKILSFFKQFFTNKKILSFGIDEKSDFWATNLKEKNGCFSFDCFSRNTLLGKISLKVFGQHNVENALAAIAVCFSIGIEFKTIKQKLENFENVQRRFEILKQDEFTIISDYAHHPTEIKNTLKAAQNLPHNRIFCIFEPHTFSRTISLFNEFLNCFFDADKLILIPTYPAREKEIKGGTSFDLFKNIPKSIDKTYIKEKEGLFSYLKANIQKQDIALFVGAGTIDSFAREFVEKLKIFNKNS